MIEDEDPVSNATWVAVKIVVAATVLGLMLVYFIDMRGGH